MTASRRLPPYLLMFFLPVLAGALLVGVLMLLSFGRLHDAHQAASQAEKRDLYRIRAVSELGNEIALLLKQADHGAADHHHDPAALADQLHLAGAQLLRLEQELPDHADLARARAHFDQFRGAIEQVVAAGDDSSAGRDHLLQALRWQLRITGDLRRIRDELTAATEQRIQQHSGEIRQHVALIASYGGGLVLFLLLLWFLAARYLSRRLDALSGVLQALAAHETDPPELADTRRLAHQGSNPLATLANALLRLRDAQIEHRQALEREHAQRELLRAVLEEAPDAIELIDPDDLSFVEINQASYRMLGYSREEFGNKRLTDIQADKTEAELRDMLPQLVAQGGVEFENRHRRKDGRLIDTRVRVRPFERYGKTYLLGIWRDITAEKKTLAELADYRDALERKVAQRTAELSQERDRAANLSRDFQLILDTSPDIIVLKDDAHRFRAVSRTYILASGKHSPADFIGKTAEEVFSPALATQIRAEEETQLISGRDVIVEERNVKLAGDRRQVMSFTRSILRDGAGRLAGFLILARDISEQARATQRLAEQEEQLRLLLESTTEGIFGIDPAGVITFANRAAARLLGYPHAEQMIGLPSHEATHHHHADGRPYPAADCPITRSVRAGITLRKDDEVFWRSDGRAFPVSYSCAPMQRDKLTVGAVVFFHDVSARKQSEAALLDAMAAAQAASKAKSEFLANMSHEIRTPMNAIIGLTHLLRRDVSEPRQAGHLVKIADAAHHLLGIINDILDLSKIEAGKLEIEATDFEVERVIDNVVSLLRERIEAKGLFLTLDMIALPPLLHGDGLRLGQILLNFAGNAVKFTAHGSITLHARVVAADDRGPTLRFDVCDTGIGVTAEQRDRLFQPFEQADTSTTRKFGGTGLGLAISKRLTDLMGGQIGVDSVPGQGATFWVELPFGWPAPASTELPPASPAQLPPDEVERRLRAHAGTRLLLAEDNPLNQEVAMELLAQLGFDVDLAENGQVAVELARQHAYPLILMDMQMPVLGGLEATHAIRALPGHAATPILAMTANAFDEDRTACLAAGMNDHVAKPVDPEALYGALLRWLPAAGAQPAVPPAPTFAPAAGPSDDLRARLAAVPGLDLAAGLRSVGGRLALYERVLRKLLENALLDDLARALTAQDQPTAHRIAHTWKGVAATVGAHTQHERIIAMEARLKPADANLADPALQETLAQLRTDFAALCDDLRQALPATTADAAVTTGAATTTAAAPPDPAAVRRVADELDLLLSRDDLAAVALCRANLALLTAAFGPAARRLQQQVDDFAYEEALATLRAARESDYTGSKVSTPT
ncbi:MAG: PAS domain S-box protein [Rhodocyclaceae bacterium]|jgi:PAS domain S-box-containing protein|nr:PAS domain S-box protein [Rhodocyclaceae bacterium]